MMGQQPRTQSLFYYFRLEDQIPEGHLLRLIDRHVDLSFVRERVKSLYSSTGRPCAFGKSAQLANSGSLWLLGLAAVHGQKANIAGSCVSFPAWKTVNASAPLQSDPAMPCHL